MNVTKKKICIFFLNFITFCFHGTGIKEGTLLLTKQGIIAVEHIATNDSIFSYYKNQKIIDVVTHIDCYTASFSLQIATNTNKQLHVVPEQLLYVVNKQNWVEAQYLQCDDTLLCYGGTTVIINAINISYEPAIFYRFSVKNSHIFCATSDGIVMHNVNGDTLFQTVDATSAFVINAFPPAAPVVITVKTIFGVVLSIVGFISIYNKYFPSGDQNDSIGSRPKFSFGDRRPGPKKGPAPRYVRLTRTRVCRHSGT